MATKKKTATKKKKTKGSTVKRATKPRKKKGLGAMMRVLFDSIASSHPELNNSGFAHVANVSELRVDAPYDFCDGLQIRKATPKEAGTLKNLLLVTRPWTPMIPTRNPYETEVHSANRKPPSVLQITSALSEDQWRYHVIAFQGSNTKLQEFIHASVLTRSRLELGPTVLGGFNSPGIVFISGGSAIERLWDESSHTDEHLLSLGPAELEDLRLAFEKVTALKDDRAGLRTAINNIIQLDEIPKRSPLRFLGYISVLESLITHAPDAKDQHDSLTRQVSRKMILVGHRSVIPIPYEVFDKGVTEEKLWKLLYKYRSAIAHGATPNFKKDFKCLKSPATALEFISIATVSLMRHVLEDPDLIADLREC